MKRGFTAALQGTKLTPNQNQGVAGAEDDGALELEPEALVPVPVEVDELELGVEALGVVDEEPALPLMLPEVLLDVELPEVEVSVELGAT